MSLTNAQIAECLALVADEYADHRKRALRKGSRAAFLWPEEAADVLEAGRSLTELPRVGPWLARLIKGWIESPPAAPAPSPLRRDFMTTSEALTVLESRPEWQAELRGDLQMHTTYSDGGGTVAEMADAAEALGHEYISITDHSKGLKIAGGIDESVLAQQADEIAAVNDALAARGARLRVLRSIEVNLNSQGEVDMEDAALMDLDLVVGSFHSKLRVKEDQTERYLAALANPHVNVLGHPRGRVYNFRLGLSADWPRVFDAAVETDTAVEINCYADRQDLNRELLVHAKASGCRLSLGTDSHAPRQLVNVRLGLAAAASVGIDRDRIVNFLPRERLLEWAAARRNRALPA
ncbi:MAG: PHP domain-containing protein [Actinomycetota bacterium]|nr:PHP domain-containing protein [Actinomycetota bacterium]